VLLDVWTYTCINWRRTLPYVRAWDQRYRKAGLVTIGVHAPEFSFERVVENVRRAAKTMRVDYPVAIDNDFAIWRAFNNQYWPALYLVDARGRVRTTQFGEGEYDRVERAIQESLGDAGARDFGRELTTVVGSGAEAAAEWTSLKTPETYVGYARAERFASPEGSVPNRSHRYSAPEELRLNDWALSGEWTVGEEMALLDRGGGKATFRFHARDLHLVMGPASRRPNIPFRVTLDGKAPGTAHGVDVDAHGNGTLSEARMYQLIRQPRPTAERQFAIEFMDAGAELFSFTFG